MLTVCELLELSLWHRAGKTTSSVTFRVLKWRLLILLDEFWIVWCFHFALFEYFSEGCWKDTSIGPRMNDFVCFVPEVVEILIWRCMELLRILEVTDLWTWDFRSSLRQRRAKLSLWLFGFVSHLRNFLRTVERSLQFLLLRLGTNDCCLWGFCWAWNLKKMIVVVGDVNLLSWVMD